VRNKIAILLALAASPAWAGYQYYFTDSLQSSKAESNNKLDKCLSRAYSKLDDQVHAGAVRFAAGKAMAEGVRHLE